MNKIEYSECERLMHRAIAKAKKAQDGFGKLNAQLPGVDRQGKIEQTPAGQYYGEAFGIHSVLCALDFDHDGMEELFGLL